MSSARSNLAFFLVVVLLLIFAAAWFIEPDVADQTVEELSGTEPELGEPQEEVFPTVVIAEPVGWAEDAVPQAAQGLAVTRFAEGLDHPRVMYTLPNGDLLVTLTRSPKSAGANDDPSIMDRIRGFIAGILFAQAGAAGESPNTLMLLRDGDGDGAAEEKIALTTTLDSPSGIAWHDNKLYIANHDEVLEFAYELGSTGSLGEGRKLMDLPPGGGHWMRNIELDEAGENLYIAVGSLSNIGEQGMEIEEGRAMIWQYVFAQQSARPFATGLRNANGLDWNPWSGELWTTVNERDMLGSDLVPDYLTNVPVGAQYGWPWIYFRDNFDRRVEHPMPAYLQDYVRRPEYALGPHVAALGLEFTKAGHRLGGEFGQGAMIARHGSWNRKPPSGYDVVFVAFDERGNPQGKPIPVLSGFLNDDGTTKGRPTWVAWAADGALLVTDDTAGIIWRVIAPGAEPAPPIERLTGASMPPRRELRGDPRASFGEEDYARVQPVQ
ncbi:PQQ-dependent sugar dehydrogenase [Altererythrobacter sp. MF3-039]|uniref:PQQ-dependent sugar dehydrogenase n=1 Tax=Altererythrobacter sp. MF3-039 TaxID=3252901 RepID=UPI00390CCE0F